MSGTIIVVDDDDTVTKALARTLRIIFGDRIAVAAINQPELIEPFLPTAVLLITDGNLGRDKPDGLAVIASIRTNIPDLPCILYTSDEQLLMALATDSITFALEKPCTCGMLETAIRHVAPDLFTP